MPVLNSFKENYGDSINFLAITYSETQAVEKFLEKHSFDFEHYTEVKDLSEKLGINGYPTNILLDKNGNVAYVLGGIPYTRNKETKELEIGDGKELKEKLDKLLNDE